MHRIILSFSRLHRLSLVVLSAVAAFALSVRAYADAATTQQMYSTLMTMPSDMLYIQGVDYQSKDGYKDSALLCFTILGNRWGRMTEESDKVLCLKALCRMAYIQYFHNYDYSKALETMADAEALAQHANITLPMLSLYYGLMYRSLSEQTVDERISDNARHYLRRALDEALEEKEYHTVNVAFSNLVSDAYGNGNISSLQPEYERFTALMGDGRGHQDSIYTRFNTTIYRGLAALSDGDAPLALQLFSQMASDMPTGDDMARYLCGLHQFTARAYMAMGKDAEAIATLHTALDVALRYHLLDAQIELRKQLSDCYMHTGRREDALDNMSRHLMVKDSLLNYRQVYAIERVHFNREMKVVEHQLAEERTRRDRLISLGVVLALITVVVATATVLLTRKNRRLNADLRSMHKLNETARESAHREQVSRQEYQQRVEQLQQQLAEASPEKSKKYTGSSLGDDDKAAIMTKVMTVMSTSRDIYKPGYTLEQLADTLGVNYKYVSQVINECYDSNFNKFLNGYRIREACRRIDHEGAGASMTVEGIAMSVGFRSRSTFIQEFKRITEMTPSQYIKATTG